MSEVDLLIKELSVRRLNRRGETEMICSKAGEALKKLSVEAARLTAENARLRAASLTETLRSNVTRLEAENKSLRDAHWKIKTECDSLMALKDGETVDTLAGYSRGVYYAAKYINDRLAALQDKSDG